MSHAALAGILWVFGATLVAFLPMKHQFRPGLALLLLAPVIILWIGAIHGWVWAVLGLGAFVSMFRRPLLYISRKAMGRV